MRIAIHQPNFIPWYPFFQKMAAVDIFVLMIHCQFEKGKYQNRFQLNGRWHTMSVDHGLDPIIDKRYVRFQEDWDRIKRQLPTYDRIFPAFDPHVGNHLYKTNSFIIRDLAHMLGISTRIEFDFSTTAMGTNRLLEICRRYGATTYLAGKSGANYLNEGVFRQAGIKVEYQDLSKADTRHSLEVLHERDAIP